MLQDINELIDNIKSSDIGGNGKVLLHEGSQIRIESDDHYWNDDEGRISIYVPKENLPRNMSSITYDLDKMENVIDNAIYNTQQEYNQAYCKIDEAYAQECAKYADAENRGKSDLDWTNYIKPIADALKENNCIVVPFWIGEHGIFSVAAGDNKNVFFTTDCIKNPSISWKDKEEEIKEIAIRTQSGNVNRYFVNQDFDINSLKCDRDKIKKAVTVIDKDGGQWKEIKTDYEIAESTLEKLDSKYRWNDYRTVASNAPTGIAYISRDELPNKSDEEIATFLKNELENRFEAYLNGWLYSVVVDNCVEAWGLTNDELENYIENEIKLNENSQVVDESVIDFLENNDDEYIETIKAKIPNRQR